MLQQSRLPRADARLLSKLPPTDNATQQRVLDEVLPRILALF